MKLTLAVVLIALALSAVPMLAQTTPVSPPPHPSEATPVSSGPSLEVTLKFIADKVTEQGEITYREGFATDGVPDDSGFMVSEDYRPASYDASACSIKFHYTAKVDNEDVPDASKGNPIITLKDVKKIRVVDHSQDK